MSLKGIKCISYEFTRLLYFWSVSNIWLSPLAPICHSMKYMTKGKTFESNCWNVDKQGWRGCTMMEAFTSSDMMCHHKVVRCLENDVCDKIILNLMVALIKSPVASRIKTYATLLIVTWYQGQIVSWQLKCCHWKLSYPGKTAEQP